MLTVQRPLGGMAAFVTYSSSHGDPEGPQGPWGVRGETDHGWKMRDTGVQGGTEQIKLKGLLSDCEHLGPPHGENAERV